MFETVVHLAVGFHSLRPQTPSRLPTPGATQDALGLTWAFAHDAAGNTTSSTYPTGETVSRTYTADDLLATSAYSTGESYAFAYTPTHRLARVTDGAGRALSFAYNPVG